MLGCPWPWIAGAPSAALKKKDSGVCPIIIGEVFHQLASRIYCSAVCSNLIDILIPYDQVGLEVMSSLKVAIHATCYCLQQYGANLDLHSLLKLDMHKAFNECH